MKICDYNGYEMHLPTSGGKAGKGNQKTSCVQVCKDGNVRIQFRFTMGDELSKSRAIQRAKDYAQLPS